MRTFDFVSGSRLGMQDGGALLGKGVYGCILNHAMSCKSGTRKQFPKEQSGIRLTKIMFERHARIEINIARMLHGIQGWDRYFAIPDSICEPAEMQSKETVDDLKSCDVAKRANKTDSWDRVRILSMIYRGKNLKNYSYDMNTFQLLPFFIQLLEAGSQLTLHRIVHRDLHSANVLVDRFGRARFIDFNLSIHVTPTIPVSRLLHEYTSSLHQESPDMMLINALDYKMNGQRILQQFIKKRPLVRYMESVLSYSHTDIVDDLMVMHDLPCMLDVDMEGWFQTYWNTIDSWSIAMLILDIMQTLQYHPRFLSIYGSNKDMIQRNKTAIRRVLRLMCEMNPEHRIDCVQALKELDPAHPILKSSRAAEWPMKNKTKKQERALQEYGAHHDRGY